MDESPAKTVGFAALRQFMRPREKTESCELCGTAIRPEHPHMVEIASRKLLCACDACALLFDNQASARYRRVPRDSRNLPDFQMSDAQWNALQIPIGTAFFFRSTPAERVVAIYPSPAGPVESLLPLDSWTEIVGANPLLEKMQADVEALLVNRLGAMNGFGDPEFYLTPVDQCYRLVGLLRLQWRGLSGGVEVWKELRRFFADLKMRSVREGVGCHA